MSLIAFIGAIKGYKGIDELVSAFTNAPDPNFRLVIAGQVRDRKTAKMLMDAASADPRILLEIKFLTDAEFEEIALAADMVVLPFRKVLHSGSLVYALSCGKRVLTPEGEFANDYQRVVGDCWIKTYKRPLKTNSLYTAIGQSPGPLDLDVLSSAASGQKLKAFYLQLLNRGGSPTSVVTR